MEADLKSICNGTKNPQDVLQSSLRQYSAMFDEVQLGFSFIRQSMQQHFDAQRDGYNASNQSNRDRDNRGGGGSGRDRGSGRGPGSYNRNDYHGDDDQGPDSGPSRGRGRGRGRTSTRNQRPNSTSNQGAAPVCNHGKTMVLRTVKKTGQNQGRNFYTCPENDQCGSFEWADGEESATTFNRNRNIDSEMRTNSIGNPRCDCGKPSLERTSLKERSRGRKYYNCSTRECNFFEWVD